MGLIQKMSRIHPVLKRTVKRLWVGPQQTRSQGIAHIPDSFELIGFCYADCFELIDFCYADSYLGVHFTPALPQ